MSKLCVSLKEKYWEAFEHTIQGLAAEVDMVELRLDDLEDIEIPRLQHPHILTLGTRHKTAPELRRKVWQRLHALKSHWIDLAWEDRSWFSKVDIDWDRVVLSYHHHEDAPLDVEELLREMKVYPAAKIKIVTPAHSVLDALRMLILQKKEGSRFLGICTGFVGEITRLLAPLVHGEWMYAALSADQAVAPGQVPWKEMKERFYFQDLSPKSFVLAVIGFPVEHSKGIIFHNAVIKALGLDGVFVRISLHEYEVASFFNVLQQLPFFKGLAVTMPLKEKVLPYLHADIHVKEIGACNTLNFTPEGIVGLNTDGLGALNALERRGPVAGKRLWVIGAGGAAKAIVIEAVHRGAQVCVFNRNEARAAALAERAGCAWRPLSALGEGEYDILVNATSVGMKGHSQERIIEADFLRPGTWVMDIVTTPQETLLLREAKVRGCITISGIEMLVLQGVEQWEFWFPEIDTQRVETAMLNVLSK